MKQKPHSLLSDENYQRFLRWRPPHGRTVSLKLAYVDAADGDLVAGVLLSQILYWFSPDKHGQPRIRVIKDSRYCLAKKRNDWNQECRITAKQYDRAIAVLVTKGIVNVRVHKFDGTPIPHISVNWEGLMTKLHHVLSDNGESRATDVLPTTICEEQQSALANLDLAQMSKSITKESLSETSSEVNNTGDLVSHLRERDLADGLNSSEAQPESVVLNEGDQGQMVQELLAIWRGQVPGQVLTDEETHAAQELLKLGLISYPRESVIERFVKLALKQEPKSLEVVLRRYRRHLEARARVFRHACLNPGRLSDQDEKLIELVTSWCLSFQDFHDRQYNIADVDIQEARRFICDDPELNVKRTLDIADFAWEDSREPERRGGYDPHFYSRKAGTLRTFLRFFENIAQEVKA